MHGPILSELLPTPGRGAHIAWFPAYLPCIALEPAIYTLVGPHIAWKTSKKAQKSPKSAKKALKSAILGQNSVILTKIP